MNDSHDAEDVVQQSFLRAYRAFETFRGDDARSWLLTIVRNGCFTELRRRRGRRNGHEPLDEDVPSPADDAGDPHAALVRRIDADSLGDALQRLPDVFREAFVLREMEGLSYSQIAEVVGVPVGTVMSRLARARQRLAEALIGQDVTPFVPRRED